jgi:hypothetical protein
LPLRPKKTLGRLVQDVARRSLDDAAKPDILSETLRWMNSAFRGARRLVAFHHAERGELIESVIILR